MRKGFTLLEILIVMAVMSFATVSLITSFGQSQERVEYQQNVNEIVTTINTARASAFNGDTHSESERIAMLMTNGQKVTSYINLDEGKLFDPRYDSLLKEIDFGGKVEVKKIFVFGGKDEQIKTDIVGFIFNPTTQTCEFATNKSLKIDESKYMVVLYLGPVVEENNKEDTINRYLYFHKKSCLPEILSTPPIEI